MIAVILSMNDSWKFKSYLIFTASSNAFSEEN